jgi:hypothetical protein
MTPSEKLNKDTQQGSMLKEEIEIDADGKETISCYYNADGSITISL